MKKKQQHDTRTMRVHERIKSSSLRHQQQQQKYKINNSFISSEEW